MTIEPQAEADPAALQAQVSGSSFYAAMRVMPKAERAAMFAIYSYCRMVDDIADDGTRPRAARATELDRWRDDLGALYAGRPAGRAGFLKQAVQEFGLRQADFLAVIDGMAPSEFVGRLSRFAFDGVGSQPVASVGPERVLASEALDADAVEARLGKRREELTAEIDRGERKLSNQGFVAKAPAAVVEEERGKLENYRSELAELG